ncbi:unnamed protein product [Caenorhabditis sp. 36 PRJEB53466]|nr:unnamed protein product [Caenorhabditis sp. 36 PRJEB53466]
MPALGGIADCELIYSIWQYNGSIYGPYASDDMYRFYLEGKLEFPTRVQISETRKRGQIVLLDYFGTVCDLQDLFGLHYFFPKRLSQFRGKWPLPEIHPNVSLLALEPNNGFNPLTFNFATFLSNLTCSDYCPFITGVAGEVPDEQVLPLSSVLELARRILMEYSNLDLDERQHLHILLTEVFSPRICNVCQKFMEDQHTYMIHALSVIHLENAVMRNHKVFTVEMDYLKLRRMIDEVRKYTFDRKMNKIATKLSARQQAAAVAAAVSNSVAPTASTSAAPQPPVWNQPWIPGEFSLGPLLPLQ